MKFCGIAVALILLAFGAVHAANAEDPAAAVYMRTKDASAAASDAASALIAKARSGGTVSVIVTIDQTIDVEPDARSEAFRKQQSNLFAAQDQLVSRIHFGRKRLKDADRFETVPMLVMDVSEQELNRLMRDPKVISLEFNRKITLKPRLEEMRDMTDIELIWGPGRGNKGNGESIAIIDDGVDSALPSINGRVIVEKCISVGPSCFDPVTKTYTEGITSGQFAAWACLGRKPHALHALGKYCNTHGATVTSVAAASRVANMAYDGFGPKLNIIFVRLSGQHSTLATFVKAFEMAFTASKLHLTKVITTSVAWDRSATPCAGQVVAFDTIIKKIRDSGMVVTNSAGNDKTDTIIDFPGCHPDVLSIGASTDKTDKIAAFSDLSYMVDFLAPGDDVVLAPGGETTSGTSFSTPSVATALVLLHHAFPSKKMNDIVTALRCGGKYLNRPGTITSIPRIDADAAYDILGKAQIKQNFEFGTRDRLANWNVSNGGWTFENGMAVSTPPTLNAALSAIYTDLCLDDFTVEAHLRSVIVPRVNQFPAAGGGIVLNYMPKGDLKLAGMQPINGYFFFFGGTLGSTNIAAGIYKTANCILAVGIGVCPFPPVCTAPAAPLDLVNDNTLKVIKTGRRLQFFLNGTKVCETLGEDDRFRSAGVWSTFGPIQLGPASVRKQVFDYLRFTAK